MLALFAENCLRIAYTAGLEMILQKVGYHARCYIAR